LANQLVGLIIIVVVALAFFTLIKFNGAEAANSIHIDVSKVYSLSVLESGQELQKIHVSVYLTLSYNGSISSTTINGKIRTLFDAAQKSEVTFSNPQVTVSGQKLSLASFEVSRAQIETWASTQYGSHSLKFLIPVGTTLTVNFADGKTETKTYTEASAVVALNVQSDSGIISSDITVENGTEYVTQPIPPTTSVNYADVPTDWLFGQTWSGPWYVDNSVLHNGHVSIRSERSGSLSREILAIPTINSLIPVKPGDHIVFKVWMKLGASTVGCSHQSAGMRLGIDFKRQGNRITGVQSLNGAYWTSSGGYPSNQYLSYVHWGNDWTQRVMDFIVPAQYPADGATMTAGTLVVPDSMVPWIQVWCDEGHAQTDNGLAWFADAELYVNP
jgi:hypothetical protein